MSAVVLFSFFCTPLCTLVPPSNWDRTFSAPFAPVFHSSHALTQPGSPELPWHLIQQRSTDFRAQESDRSGQNLNATVSSFPTTYRWVLTQRFFPFAVLLSSLSPEEPRVPSESSEVPSRVWPTPTFTSPPPKTGSPPTISINLFCCCCFCLG